MQAADTAGDLCVVVPGMGGSKLAKDGRIVWDVTNRAFVSALLSGGDAFVELTLSARDDGIVAAGPISGLTFVPAFWSDGRLDPLLALLRKRFGSTNLLVVGYDWRRSIARGAIELRRAIDVALDERPRGTGVVLIGHSMGGLVARRYLACEGGAERCSLLVTVGTPYRGAAKALDVLAHGRRGLLGPLGRRFRTFLGSLPSVHELLPTYDCFLDADGSRSPLADRIPAPFASELYEAATAIGSETMNAVTRLGAEMPQTVAVVSQGHWTPTLARWDAHGDFSIVGRDDRSDLGPLSRGDGTVPRGSGQPPEWGEDPTRAHVVAGRHLDLPNKHAMYRAMQEALDGRRYMALGPDEGGRLDVDIPDVAYGGDQIEVCAAHPGDRLSLDLRISDAITGAAVSHTALVNLGDGRYRQVLPRLGPGQYEIAVTGLVDGRPQRASELLTVFPPTAVP